MDQRSEPTDMVTNARSKGQVIPLATVLKNTQKSWKEILIKVQDVLYYPRGAICITASSKHIHGHKITTNITPLNADHFKQQRP